MLGELLEGFATLLEGIQQQPVVHPLSCHRKRQEVTVHLAGEVQLMLRSHLSQDLLHYCELEQRRFVLQLLDLLEKVLAIAADESGELLEVGGLLKVG